VEAEAVLRANRRPDDGELARALSSLVVFLGAVGRHYEALALTEEAVMVLRELAKSNPAYLGDMAAALNSTRGGSPAPQLGHQPAGR
jgi:hypothetical protein